MTRQEHLDWCKRRALEYVEAGEPRNAVSSMLSDLSKHEETKQHAGIQLAATMLMAGMLETEADVREFIEGFN